MESQAIKNTLKNEIEEYNNELAIKNVAAHILKGYTKSISKRIEEDFKEALPKYSVYY